MYLKKSIYILGLFILISCTPETNRQKMSYYPSKSAFENESFLVPINLDTTSLNYMDIVQMTPDVDYIKDVPYFKIIDGNQIKNIVPFLPVLIKRSELIVITEDSVFADKKYPIEDLKKVMQNIFGNQKQSKFYNYKGFPNYARVAIDIDTNSTGKDIKKMLIKTTNAFDEVKKTLTDSLHLSIYFDIIESMPKPKKTHDNN